MKNLAVLTFHLIIYLKINLLFGQSLTGFKPLRRSISFFLFPSFSLRFICRPSAASPPLLSLCSLPHHSLPPPLHCSIFPLTGSLLCPGVCCDLLYVKTLFSPPFSSLTCCPLPFTAKPHERVVYSLQFLNIHSVPGRVLPTSVLAAM